MLQKLILKIYIPVWIDLKAITRLILFPLRINLHSSMDRFEAVVAMENSSVVAIYIPVWIDLKCIFFHILYMWNCIYIPVWIDLKSNDWIYTKKVDKYDKIEDKQRRNKNDRKEKQ